MDQQSQLAATGCETLKSGDWIHLVAVGGTGMGALAALLQDLGFRVTGSDHPLYPPMSSFLESREISVRRYSESNLSGESWGFQDPNPALVVIGNAISRGHPEAEVTDKLIEQKKTLRMSFAQALAEFAISDKKSFVVTGTHGKTTTTSILAWALESLNQKPGFFIGGLPSNFNSGCRLGEGKVFASEGDEYDTAYWDKESKFLHYRPHWVLCTGIEFDHADIFSSLDEIVQSFKKLVPKTKCGWILIDKEGAARADAVEELAEAMKGLKGPSGEKLRLLRYGFATDSDYQLRAFEARALPWKKERMGTWMKLRFAGETAGELRDFEVYSPMSGRHNALNVLGVLAMLHASGEIRSREQAQEALKDFKGVKRRQEELSFGPRTVVIDDFAHHPTAIRETVSAIKDRYPGFKVAAFFEARSATSARNVLAEGFASSFDQADAVFLSPPSKTNIPENEKLDIDALLKNIRGRPANQDKTLVLEKEISGLVKAFKSWREQLQASEKCVALVMSNGPFGGIHAMLADQGA